MSRDGLWLLRDAILADFDGEINGKYPGGVESQKLLLEESGIKS
ncbi:MAG: hypothetical protein QXU75_02630 [Candidatus Methanomethylicaceae archaeon]